jgi:type IV secretion system protein VirB9
MKKLIFSLLLSGFVASSAYAKITPLKMSTDARIEVVPYSAYNVVPIHGTTFTSTQIIFAKNEFIENIQNGDLAAWTASVDKNIPYMLFIKPTVYGSNTNMTVVTNKHTYYFHLVSNSEDNRNPKNITYAIKFIYPQAQRTKIENEIIQREEQRQAEISAFKNPSAYNWNYSFSGDRSIVPIHVFDDGKFTYLQLQKNQPIPAVFAVTSPSGKEAVVNYRRDGNYLVIQRIAPQFTLRLGATHVASIFNNKLIQKMRGL